MSLIYPKSVQAVEEMLNSFMPFAKERLGYPESPDIRLAKDPDNAQDPLGKTAYYEPQHKRITVYIDGRHVKDIMRSISHEMVHHAQNLRGDLAGSASVGEQGYAQNDEHLREMEREAYEQGNLCFRDWEDGIRTGGLYEAFDRGDLISMIRDYSRELTGYRDEYGDMEKLDKMSDEELQAYYQGMSDSPEAQDMERRFRDEEEAELGTDTDFDRMPKKSGMSRGLRETNMFDKRRAKLNKRLMESFGYKTPMSESADSLPEDMYESGQHRPFQIGDYVRIIDGGLRGAAGKIIELVELVTGEDGFVVLLDNPADKRVFGQAGDEVIVAADKVEPPAGAHSDREFPPEMGMELYDIEEGSGYKWDSTSELERAMSGMDKETFKQVLKDVQKQLGLSDEEMAQRVMKFVNSGSEEERSLQELFGLFGDSDEVKTLNGAAQKIAQEEENYRTNVQKIKELVNAYKDPGVAIGKLESSVGRIKGVLETYASAASKMEEKDFKDHKTHKVVKKLRQDSDIVTSLTAVRVQDVADAASDAIKELTRKAKLTAQYAQQDMQDKDTSSANASYTRNNRDNEFASGMFGTDDPMDVHRESLRKALKNNPELVKSIQKVGIEKIKEEMSKRDFVNQAWEKAGATSRHISDEEAGAVESFNNWLEADPMRQGEWEPAQSYRNGRVLAYNRKEKKYYDVQADMFVDDAEMDAILPESVKFQNELKTKLQNVFKKHPHLAENKEFINKLKIGLKTTLTERYKK